MPIHELMPVGIVAGALLAGTRQPATQDVVREIAVDFNWRRGEYLRAYLDEVVGGGDVGVGEILDAFDEDGTRRFVRVAGIGKHLYLEVLPETAHVTVSLRPPVIDTAITVIGNVLDGTADSPAFGAVPVASLA
ncbi:hypothetical protein K6U06_10910 [Acidiferrimicrobium sp. IK]|uniref:hypothetical protein n=1 Tax=Acidiferrimicrobium sp. IK TaxID=2871700 RepID=UPI0021CB64AA|nr:hypothetical protein [Acidiferrimicrobium sp. IK]MCU4184870.1 hypothetical protein [Acidiferrimicrobium sp. IK]